MINELVLEARQENLPQAAAFVEERLEAAGCPARVMIPTGVAVEEVFVNIASYAYPSDRGDVRIRLETGEGLVTITFADHGIPYNPLAREDPDTSLPVFQREVGGLGILMTKKLMDEVSYEYKDGENILTLKKKI